MSQNLLRLKLSSHNAENLAQTILHEDGHSVQDRKNVHIDEEIEKDYNSSIKFMRRGSALRHIFTEGFAQLIAGKDNVQELCYIYGQEIFETIRLAKGFDVAVGFGLYARPTIEIIKKEYLDDCGILNRSPQINLEEAITEVAEQTLW